MNLHDPPAYYKCDLFCFPAIQALYFSFEGWCWAASFEAKACPPLLSHISAESWLQLSLQSDGEKQSRAIKSEGKYMPANSYLLDQMPFLPIRTGRPSSIFMMQAIFQSTLKFTQFIPDGNWADTQLPETSLHNKDSFSESDLMFSPLAFLMGDLQKTSHVWKPVQVAQTLLTPLNVYFYTSPITNVLKKISFFLYGHNEFLMNFIFDLHSQIRNHLLHMYNTDRFCLEAI